MSKPARKFGASGLNALNSAIDTVSDAMDQPKQIVDNNATVVPPAMPQEPVVNPVSPTTEAAVITADPAPATPVEERKPAKKSHTSKAKDAKDNDKTIYVGVQLSLDLYAKLQQIRIEEGKIPLRTLCLQIIQDYVDKRK